MRSSHTIILGASGFVGDRLVGRFARQGGAGVQAVDLSAARRRVEGVVYRTHDVRQPIPPAWGEGVGLLYNLAAVHRTPGHPDHAYYDANIGGALTAVAFAEACGIETIVFTSSISVYGPSEAPLTEASPLSPVTAYGRSKRLAELIHLRWAAAAPERRRLVIVRPGVIFGPGEGGNYTQLAKALRGGYFFYPGRRDTVKSGGYVDELLLTLEFALARPERQVLYNFVYPDLATTEEIVRTFGEVAGYGTRRPTLPLPLLKVAAGAFQLGAAVGLRSWIHPDRVMKLVQSTKISPVWLLASGYQFSTNLRSALELWRDETDGRFD